MNEVQPEDQEKVIEGMVKLDSIKKEVEKLLETDDRCRNDDKWLIWRYFHDVRKIKFFIPFDEFKEMPAFESIRRLRQVIQNTDMKLLPTDPEVRKQRGINQERWTIWCARAKEQGYDLDSVLKFVHQGE